MIPYIVDTVARKGFLAAIVSMGLVAGAFVAASPRLAAGVTAAAVVAWLLAGLPVTRTAPPAFAVLALVYVQAATESAYVGDIPPTTRYVRDGLLVLMLFIYALKRKRLDDYPRLWTSIVGISAVATISLFRAEDFETIALARYFALVPILGWVTAANLRQEGADPVRLIGRTVVLVGSASAFVGILQSAGIISGGFYAGYTTLGLVRSVGLIGQPNNQAFLLTLAIACCRMPGIVGPKARRALSLILLAGTVLTFSRAAILLLGVALIMPIRIGEGLTKQKQVSRILAFGVLGSLPFIAAARGLQTISDSSRRALTGDAVQSIDLIGFLIGQPALRNGRITDNLWVDMLLIGGIGYLLCWIWILGRLWQAARYEYLSRVSIVMLVLGGFAYVSFIQFPTVLYCWTLIAAAVIRGGPSGSNADRPANARSRLPPVRPLAREL